MPSVDDSFGKVPDGALKEAGGILPVFEAFYLESIAYASERAVAAFARFDAALARGDATASVVAGIQEALTHVGAVSKLFWPPRDNGISNARGEKLRRAFDLQDSSPLKNRELRDTLEHFDERLDLYLQQFPTGQIIPGPVVASVASLTAPLRAFRLVDPHRLVFVILDQQYEFGPLREATEDVLEKALKMLRDGGRLEGQG